MYLIKLQTLILSTVYFTLEKDELCIKLSVYCPCDVITILTQYVVHNNNILALKYEIIELALLMEHNKQETNYNSWADNETSKHIDASYILLGS